MRLARRPGEGLTDGQARQSINVVILGHFTEQSQKAMQESKRGNGELEGTRAEVGRIRSANGGSQSACI